MLYMSTVPLGLFSEIKVTNNIPNLFPPTETLFVYRWVDVVEEGNGHHLYLSRTKEGPKLNHKQEKE